MDRPRPGEPDVGGCRFLPGLLVRFKIRGLRRRPGLLAPAWAGRKRGLRSDRGRHRREFRRFILMRPHPARCGPRCWDEVPRGTRGPKFLLWFPGELNLYCHVRRPQRRTDAGSDGLPFATGTRGPAKPGPTLHPKFPLTFPSTWRTPARYLSHARPNCTQPRHNVRTAPPAGAPPGRSSPLGCASSSNASTSCLRSSCLSSCPSLRSLTGYPTWSRWSFSFRPRSCPHTSSSRTTKPSSATAR